MKPATSTTFPTFHQKFLGRILSLDIMDPSSVVLAQRIAEDGLTKVPADKILEIDQKHTELMTSVQASESQFVGQVLPLLKQADAGLKSQIQAYLDNGDLSGDKTDEEHDAVRSLVENDGGQASMPTSDQPLHHGPTSSDPNGYRGAVHAPAE